MTAELVGKETGVIDDVKDQEQAANATDVAGAIPPGDSGEGDAAEEAIGERLDEGTAPPNAAAGVPEESSGTAEKGKTADVDEAAGTAGDGGAGGPEVRRAEFEKLTPRTGSPSGDNIDLLLDVTVPVTVELGATEMLVKEILAVGPGSVVKLDRPLGKPLDILVNGELVGRGEVVVVDEQFGVRVTELVKHEAKRK